VVYDDRVYVTGVRDQKLVTIALEQATGELRRRGAQAEERRQRREAIGMRLGERVSRIGDRVVRRPRGGPGSAQNALLVLRSQPTRMGTTLPLAVCSR
jgi:hypothetical protein